MTGTVGCCFEEKKCFSIMVCAIVFDDPSIVKNNRLSKKIGKTIE